MLIFKQFNYQEPLSKEWLLIQLIINGTGQNFSAAITCSMRKSWNELFSKNSNYSFLKFEILFS